MGKWLDRMNVTGSWQLEPDWDVPEMQKLLDWTIEPASKAKAKVKTKPVEPPPSVEKKDLATMGICKLELLLIDARREIELCSRHQHNKPYDPTVCTKCPANPETYGLTVGCEELPPIIELALRIKRAEEKLWLLTNHNTAKDVPPCKGNCNDCEYLDAGMMQAGFHFCRHWHNYTKPDGFCYAYQGREPDQDPVDKS